MSYKVQNIYLQVTSVEKKMCYLYFIPIVNVTWILGSNEDFSHIELSHSK